MDSFFTKTQHKAVSYLLWWTECTKRPFTLLLELEFVSEPLKFAGNIKLCFSGEDIQHGKLELELEIMLKTSSLIKSFKTDVTMKKIAGGVTGFLEEAPELINMQ